MNCISCGMPMNEPEQHAQGDTSNEHCVHCARPDGSMVSYDEALMGMTHFMVKSQGIAEEAAREAAKDMMSRLPAWKDR